MENNSENNNTGTNTPPVPGSFAAAFENEIAERIEAIKAGRIVQGTVTEIDSDFVHVDIGYKSIGIVEKQQFFNIDEELTVGVGDRVDVYIVSLENNDSQLVLSHERATQLQIWKDVEEKHDDGGVVRGRVQHKVKGGLQVDIGIPAFLPGSQVDIKPHKNLEKFLGEIFDFKVLKITKDKGNIVVSRKSLLLSEREELRTETLKAIGEGVVLEGTVKNLTDYGAFVDLGGIDGLLHITDITWGHIDHPGDKLAVGQRVPVVVTSYDQEKQRVSLGMKQLTEDPWEKAVGQFSQDQRITGKIAGITDHGMHIELPMSGDETIEGFMHRDNLSWSKSNRNFGKDYEKGQELEVQITEVNIDERKLTLSLKHLLENPWDTLAQLHPVGSTVKGPICSITEFGLFVTIQDGIDGLVRPADISWTDRYNNIGLMKEKFTVGEEVEAKILDIVPRDERLSLGMKQLEQDPWAEIIQRYPEGTRLTGKITEITDYGLFVELEAGVTGLIHKSQLGISKSTDIKEEFKDQKEIECTVIAIDSADSQEHRISLSVKTATAKRQKRSTGASNFSDDMSAPTFGDLIKEQMDND